MYTNLQFLRGHIFHVLQHFATKLGNSTNFRMINQLCNRWCDHRNSYFEHMRANSIDTKRKLMTLTSVIP